MMQEPQTQIVSLPGSHHCARLRAAVGPSSPLVASKCVHRRKELTTHNQVCHSRTNQRQ